MPTKKPDTPSVVDEVIGEITASTTPANRWFHRVAKEHMPLLADLRQAWFDGRLGTKRRTAAKSIAKILTARGIATVGEQGVEEWLKRA